MDEGHRGADRDEGEILETYRDVLRGMLGKLAPDVAAIRGQLEAACSELRDAGETRTLLLALQNLQGLFALLDQLVRSIGEVRLPALDRLDKAVREFVPQLDRYLGPDPQPALITPHVETKLLPALDTWKDVELDLAAAIEIARPPSEVDPRVAS